MDTLVSPPLPISAVERETGISKDVLRKWESRYGFPLPERDMLGERLYPSDQVQRLRLIKRLMDTGMRPSRLVNLTDAELRALAPGQRPDSRPKSPPAAPDEAPEADQGTGLDWLRRDDAEGLRRALYRDMMRVGIKRFVLDTLCPLNHAVGEAWARGELNIHQEHVYSEAVQWLLRDVCAQLTDPAGHPRVLLTTLPEEQHGLGILMVATLFALEGAHCISLGTQTPVQVIVEAARAHAVDMVVLSFSIAYPSRRILPALDELARLLPPSMALWAGGAGVERLKSGTARVRLTPTLDEALADLQAWRREPIEIPPLSP